MQRGKFVVRAGIDTVERLYETHDDSCSFRPHTLHIPGVQDVCTQQLQEQLSPRTAGMKAAKH